MTISEEILRLQDERDRVNKELEKFNSPWCIWEMEFETKLRDLMSAYGMDLPYVISTFFNEPKEPKEPEVAENRDKPRPSHLAPYEHFSLNKRVTYINPFTKESVHTIGKQSRLLKSWIDRHGEDEVQTWIER